MPFACETNLSKNQIIPNKVEEEEEDDIRRALTADFVICSYKCLYGWEKLADNFDQLN